MSIDTTDQPRLDHAVRLYLEGIRDGHPREAIAAYTGERYTQHSTGVRDGAAGFLEFFEPFLERNPKREIDIVRGWEDGRYVFLQAYQSLNDGDAQWVTTDFFDTDEAGKIVEHWDVIAPYPAPAPSGRTSVDGPTEPRDLEKTEANKAHVREMLTQLLMRDGDCSTPERYISAERFVQHNPEIDDGLTAFRELLLRPDRPVWVERIVLLVGRGDLVATLCEVVRGGERYAQVDIFRLENGLIVEHWDNLEKCPPPEELVNVGKF